MLSLISCTAYAQDGGILYEQWSKKGRAYMKKDESLAALYCFQMADMKDPYKQF